MKKILIAVVFTIAASFAYAVDVGIASGQKGGTNYPMIENIVGACSKPGSAINNVTSDGSLDNIYKVYGDKTTQYSISQTDALFYMKGVDPKMMDRILMVFPFFSTEIQVVVKANSSIKNLNDLANKRVIEGPGDTSGTWVTAQVIKKLTGINWNAMNASISDGAVMVANGQADAEIIVAGAPISAVANTPGLRVIPLSHPALDSFALYTRAIIGSGTYPGQTSAISTYKVDNALITYAFKNQFQKEIGDLIGCISANIGNLQANGHPKWRDVNVASYKDIAWPMHPAAKAAIDRSLKQR
jgi:TRAP transporter TAXI family solute receptor